MKDRTSSSRLTVLIDVRKRHAKNNPYIAQLVASAPGSLRTRWFSWHAALAGRYDVVHFNWPEHVVNCRFRQLSPLATFLGYTWYLRLWLTRKPIVMTMHNKQPHDALCGLRLRLYNMLIGLPRHSVYLNSFELEGRHSGSASHIPHGHYVEWFQKHAAGTNFSSQRLVSFGIMKPYKQHDRLIEAYSLTRIAADLVIAGETPSKDYEMYLQGKIADSERIKFYSRRLSDRELAKLVSSAVLAVLPYRDFYNSGALLASLSLGTPVLVPKGEVSCELQMEFGPQWVWLYEEPLRSEIIEEVHRQVTAYHRDGIPDMQKRDWRTIAMEFYRVYSSVRTFGPGRTFSNQNRAYMSTRKGLRHNDTEQQ